VSSIVFTLILINIIIPLITIWKTSFKKNGLVINHVLLFSVGFIYYWIYPIVIGFTKILEINFSLVEEWYTYFDSLSEDTIFWYLLHSCLIYLSFVLGPYLFLSKKNRQIKGASHQVTQVKKSSKKSRIKSKYINFLFTVIVIGIIILILPSFLPYFGLGYQAEINFHEIKLAGFFVGLSILVILIGIYDNMLIQEQIKKQQKDYKKFIVLKLFANLIFVVYFLMSFIILSLGSRLYSVYGLCSLLVYYSFCIKPITYRNALIGFVGVLLFVSAIGAWRLGITISLESIFFYFTAESFFTSFSLITFLTHWDGELLNFPFLLISDFINLVPSIFFPNKGDLIMNISDFGYFTKSPLGALHSFVSFMANFGVFGTIFIIFIFSKILSYLEKHMTDQASRIKNYWYKLSYIGISASLVITFFRDPFSVSIVKIITQFSIIMPFLYLVLSEFIYAILPKTSRK
jgi:hypothetical protein